MDFKKILLFWLALEAIRNKPTSTLAQEISNVDPKPIGFEVLPNIEGIEAPPAVIDMVLPESSFTHLSPTPDDESKSTVDIPKDLYSVAADIIPGFKESLQTSSGRRSLIAETFETDSRTAQIIKQQFDGFQQYRNAIAAIPSVDPKLPILRGHDYFIVRSPMKDSSGKRRLSTHESDNEVENLIKTPVRRLQGTEYENTEIAQIIATENLPILQQDQYMIDLSAITNPDDKIAKIQELIDAGLSVQFDMKTSIDAVDIKDDPSTTNPQLLRNLATANNELDVSIDRCMWILDTCSLLAQEWQKYGFKPEQMAYVDQFCTPGYSRHGAASVYAALKNDPQAQVFFISVFDQYGGGSIGTTLAGYEKALKQLAQRQINGECLQYAGISYSGTGNLPPNVDTQTLISFLVPTYESLRAFDFVAEASGNSGYESAPPYSICDLSATAWVRRYLNQKYPKGYTGPLNIITAYTEASLPDGKLTKIRPSYANIEAKNRYGECVDLAINTNLAMPDMVLYGRAFYGGTSCSTAMANGLVSRITIELKKAGFIYTSSAIISFLNTIAKEFTDAKLQVFPYDMSGYDTRPIYAPGHKTLNMENILGAVQNLINSAPTTPLTTQTPTKFSTPSPTFKTSAPSTKTTSTKTPTTMQTSSTKTPTTKSPTATSTPTIYTAAPVVSASETVYKINTGLDAIPRGPVFSLTTAMSTVTQFKFDPENNARVDLRGNSQVFTMRLLNKQNRDIVINFGKLSANTGAKVSIAHQGATDISAEIATVSADIASKVILTKDKQSLMHWKKSSSGWLLQVQTKTMPITWSTLLTISKDIDITGIQIGASVAGDFKIADVTFKGRSDVFDFYYSVAKKLEVKAVNSLTVNERDAQYKNAQKGINTELIKVGILDELADTADGHIGKIYNDYIAKKIDTVLIGKISKGFPGTTAANQNMRKFLTLVLALRDYGLDANKNFNDDFKDLVTQMAGRGHDELATLMINLLDSDFIEQINNIRDNSNAANNIRRRVWISCLQINHPSWNPSSADIFDRYNDGDTDSITSAPTLFPGNDSGSATANGVPDEVIGATVAASLVGIVTAAAAINKRKKIGLRIKQAMGNADKRVIAGRERIAKGVGAATPMSSSALAVSALEVSAEPVIRPKVSAKPATPAKSATMTPAQSAFVVKPTAAQPTTNPVSATKKDITQAARMVTETKIPVASVTRSTPVAAQAASTKALPIGSKLTPASTPTEVKKTASSITDEYLSNIKSTSTKAPITVMSSSRNVNAKATPLKRIVKQEAATVSEVAENKTVAELVQRFQKPAEDKTKPSSRT